MSLNQLAAKSGVAKGYLWRIENSASQRKEVRPSAEILHRIAQALGTTVTDLLGEAPGGPPPAIPASLREYARVKNLPDGDVQMLAQVEYRGLKPETIEDWDYIYQSIWRTIVGRPGDSSVSL
ncbi:MAG: helix-turn-helix transcriptional regulator [Chloroflexi bacterium]|nr:helix-turn-helix transcriptional regulator [Chloroflexota bacterium]